jgi:hypothetical protein
MQDQSNLMHHFTTLIAHGMSHSVNFEILFSFQQKVGAV